MRARTLSAMAIAAAALGMLGTARPVAASNPGPTARGNVTALSVVPATGRPEVVVAVDGAVEVLDFTLRTPERIVIDLGNARLATQARFYDQRTRGGITNIRVAQYKEGVVRVVIELDAPRQYELARGTGDVRITLEGAGASFEPWHSGGAPLARATDREPAREAVREPAAPVYAAARAPADASAQPLPEARRTVYTPAPMAASQQPRITVTYQDTDIRDVIAAFATYANRTIIIGRNVSGTVTAEIKDQPWDVALRSILEAQGLAVFEDPNTGILSVDTNANILQKQATEPLVTQLVPVNYARAGSLVETIRTLLAKDCPQGTAAPAAGQQGGGQQGQGACVTRGAVAADTATNTLIISEVPSRMADIIGYVRGLDVRTPQVSLKAKLISVNRTATEQLGLSYDIGSPGGFFNTLATRTGSTGEFEVSLGGDAFAAVGNANRTFASNSSVNLIFSTMIGKYTLTAFLDALQRTNLSDVQAEPSVTTLDNREASILVGQEIPVRVLDAGGAGGAGRANVSFREVGILLRVTPHITNNGQILMTVHAEQSQLQAIGGELGFFFDKRRANNQMLVANGETAVIGGLTQTSLTRNKVGIPFLMDLPLIGKLFSQTDSQEVKNDLLILITPRIVDETETGAATPPGGAPTAPPANPPGR